MEQRYLSAVCDFYVGRLSMECDLVPSHVSLHVFVSGSSGLQVSLSVKVLCSTMIAASSAWIMQRQPEQLAGGFT